MLDKHKHNRTHTLMRMPAPAMFSHLKIREHVAITSPTHVCGNYLHKYFVRLWFAMFNIHQSKCAEYDGILPIPRYAPELFCVCGCVCECGFLVTHDKPWMCVSICINYIFFVLLFKVTYRAWRSNICLGCTYTNTWRTTVEEEVESDIFQIN